MKHHWRARRRRELLEIFRTYAPKLSVGIGRGGVRVWGVRVLNTYTLIPLHPVLKPYFFVFCVSPNFVQLSINPPTPCSLSAVVRVSVSAVEVWSLSAVVRVSVSAVEVWSLSAVEVMFTVFPPRQSKLTPVAHPRLKSPHHE